MQENVFLRPVEPATKYLNINASIETINTKNFFLTPSPTHTHCRNFVQTAIQINDKISKIFFHYDETFNNSAENNPLRRKSHRKFEKISVRGKRKRPRRKSLHYSKYGKLNHQMSKLKINLKTFLDFVISNKWATGIE